jgi:hypothetical protein
MAQEPHRAEIEGVPRFVSEEAAAYLAGLDDRPVRTPRAAQAARAFRTRLPAEGAGALAALRGLVERGMDATLASSGPRCFHFVIGGATPASIGADWLTTALDPPAQPPGPRRCTGSARRRRMFKSSTASEKAIAK